jgi:hypothetical protein
LNKRVRDDGYNGRPAQITSETVVATVGEVAVIGNLSLRQTSLSQTRFNIHCDRLLARGEENDCVFADSVKHLLGEIRQSGWELYSESSRRNRGHRQDAVRCKESLSRVARWDLNNGYTLVSQRLRKILCPTMRD